MNLLSFRTPVLYAACLRCGNALTHGEEECPHCGTNQSREMRALNSVGFNNSSVMLMPGRMLVPYPSVPEEVDAAMNIARARARIARRVAFGVASGGLLAIALALTYAPGLRSPVVQRLAALPEPAKTPAFVPVTPENAAVPASTTTTIAAATQASMTTVIAAANPVSSITSAPNPAMAMIATITRNVTNAIASIRTASSTVALSPATGPVSQGSSHPPGPTPARTTQTQITATASKDSTPGTIAQSPITAPPSRSSTPVTTAQSPVQAAPSKSSAPATTVTIAQNTITAPASKSATTATNPAPAIKPPPLPAAVKLAATPPAPSPAAIADVPLASHAPQPSTPVAKDLPKLSLPPVSPVIATERPPLGSPGESLYFTRLALATSDLSAARKNLANVPANQADSPDVQRLRDDLIQREAARDAAMQHARACDATASWRCARRYAKDALAIDASYTDSRAFLRHVAIKVAEAKKAAEGAAVLTAAAAPVAVTHSAPLREAEPTPRTATVTSTGSTSTTSTSAPHMIANPPTHTPVAPRVIRETRDAHETRLVQEARDPIATFQYAQTADVAPPEPKPLDNNAPIRPAGRGEAH